MIVIASRSSTTASVRRNVRSAVGRCVDSTASTASANAMSVAIGTAQPSRFSGCPAIRLMPTKIGGGHDHPADGGRDRQGGTRRVAQIAGDELALEFQSHDEEEDGQQSVGGPLRERQPQMQRLGAEGELRDGAVGVRPRGVRPHQGRRAARAAAVPRRRSRGAKSRRVAATPATSRGSAVANRRASAPS